MSAMSVKNALLRQLSLYSEKQNVEQVLYWGQLLELYKSLEEKGLTEIKLEDSELLGQIQATFLKKLEDGNGSVVSLFDLKECWHKFGKEVPTQSAISHLVKILNKKIAGNRKIIRSKYGEGYYISDL